MSRNTRTYAIHPAVGIARLGNAEADPADPSSYYLGAESPLEVPNEGLPYKTGGKIKKQAQRFRIYEFQAGRATREITLENEDVAAIEWTVHVANRKAALDPAPEVEAGTLSKPAVVPPKPYGLSPDPEPKYPHYWPAQTRNGTAADRAQLCIDPGPRSVGGADREKELSGTITFSSKTKTVILGKLCAEAETGRLIVFAGNGLAEGLGDNGFSPLSKLDDGQNNDSWYDDTADGSVQATITFRDGTTVTLDQPEQRAWVIGAPPRFSPHMNWLTTLYDVALSAVHSPDSVPRPSFAGDIYPVLRCVSLLQWVSARASKGHSTPAGYYLSAERMRLLANNDRSVDSDPYKARNAVFKRIRNPNKDVDRETVQKYMPQVPGDITRNAKGDYDVAALTPLQYALFRKWRDGDFEPDGVPEYVPLDELTVALQPSALDRAALEGTVGTPFYPGIESWRIVRNPRLHVASAPLRMIADTRPGDLTMGNAIPWQSDFLDCDDNWWPASRPNEVTRAGKPMQRWVPLEWKPDRDHPDYNRMVEGWWRLGFVVARRDGASYEEAEGTAQGPGA